MSKIDKTQANQNDRRSYDEPNGEEYVKSHVTNYLSIKNNEIKNYKKRSFLDKEDLYSENIKLKNKIQEVQELNIKLKTQLQIAEREKLNICQIAEEESFQPKIMHRSQSGNRKNSHQNLIANSQNLNQVASPFASQKHSIAVKKIIRDLKEEIDNLKSQNANIKKTMKYTRMTELQQENKMLLEQTIRLERMARQVKDAQNENYGIYINEIETLKKRLVLEKDSQKKNGYELKKVAQQLCDAKQKIKDIELKKIEAEKRLNKEIKNLKTENQSLKQKEVGKHSLECLRDDCLKNKKDKADLKKKIQNIEKQLKKVKDQLQIQKKKGRAELTIDKKEKTETNDQKKTIQKGKKTQPIQKTQNEVKSLQKPHISENSSHLKESYTDKLPQKMKSSANQSELTQNLISSSVPIENKHDKTQQNYESQEDQGYHQEKYEQFNDEQKQKEVSKSAKKQNKETAKSPEKPKPSKKKVESQDEQEQQILFQQEQKKQSGQQEQKRKLKCIKETLIYKFMAQHYSYDNFCSDISQSGMKNFKIGQIVNLLSEEPFLIDEKGIEAILVYLFETEDLKGNQVITAKNFVRKMKKFIGKVQLIEQQMESAYLQKISSIVRKNITKMNKKFGQYEIDQGFVSKKDFSTVLKSYGILDQQIECALSYAVYLSDDINRLNYDLFLKRFSEERQ